jgi:Pyruvate/2-oxoacid:ferredoxin oxidoreductase delta subunit
MNRRDLLRGDWLQHGRRSQVARVEIHRCLAWLGSFCSTCIEQCPEPGAMLDGPRGPVVQASSCTGCGRCAELCPAPRCAVRMLP